MLTAKDTLPVHAQFVLTEAIVDELLAGDLRALLPLIIEDTRAGLGRIQRRARQDDRRASRDRAGREAVPIDLRPRHADADTAKGRARVDVPRPPAVRASDVARAAADGDATLLELAGAPAHA